MKPKIQLVYEEEAEIIRAAETSELAILKRQAAPEGLVDPLIFAETEPEKALMAARLDIEKKFIPQCNSDEHLVLVPSYNPTIDHGIGLSAENGAMTVYQGTGNFGMGMTQYRFPQLPPIPHKYCPDGEFRATDLNLARLFVERMRVKRMHSEVYAYNGKYYHLLSENELKTAICEYLSDVLNKRGDASQLSAIKEFVETDPSIKVMDADCSKHLVCLENGVLDYRSGKLLPHSPNYFLTWTLRVRLEPEAECPTFMRFLHSVTGGDEVLKQRFMEVLGYILSPDTTAKNYYLLAGPGDSGKSAWGTVLASFYDSDQVGSLDIYKMGDRFAGSSLVHRKVNISMDLTNSSISEPAMAMIKQITGGDLIQVEQKYKAAYPVKIDTKLVFGTNHKLKLNSSDPAFLRRAVLLPFQYPVPRAQQDPFLRDKMIAEKPGIFRAAMAAYGAYLRNGRVFTGEDIYNLECMQIGDSTINMEEGLSAFAQACVFSCEGGVVPVAEVFRAYCAFCSMKALPFHDDVTPFSRSFSRVLETSFPDAHREKKRIDKKPTNCIVGIALK